MALATHKHGRRRAAKTFMNFLLIAAIRRPAAELAY
jgi:hypothetical protein